MEMGVVGVGSGGEVKKEALWKMRVEPFGCCLHFNQCDLSVIKSIVFVLYTSQLHTIVLEENEMA